MESLLASDTFEISSDTPISRLSPETQLRPFHFPTTNFFGSGQALNKVVVIKFLSRSFFLHLARRVRGYIISGAANAASYHLQRHFSDTDHRSGRVSSSLRTENLFLSRCSPSTGTEQTKVVRDDVTNERGTQTRASSYSKETTAIGTPMRCRGDKHSWTLRTPCIETRLVHRNNE